MPPHHFESEVESFLEGSHGDRTHIKRADHHTVTPLCGTLLRTASFASHPRSDSQCHVRTTMAEAVARTPQASPLRAPTQQTRPRPEHPATASSMALTLGRAYHRRFERT